METAMTAVRATFGRLRWKWAHWLPWSRSIMWLWMWSSRCGVNRELCRPLPWRFRWWVVPRWWVVMTSVHWKDDYTGRCDKLGCLVGWAGDFRGVCVVDRFLRVDVIAAVVSGIGRCRNFLGKFFRRLAVVGSIDRLCVLVGLRFLDQAGRDCGTGEWLLISKSSY